MNQILLGIIFLLVILVLGIVGGQFGETLVTYRGLDEEGELSGEFWSRFYFLLALSVLIERSVEVYLKIADLDGKRGTDPASGTERKVSDATRPAAIASLILGILIAIVGVRILEALITLNNPASSGLRGVLFYGIDILISAGLMAGGAKVVHPLAKTLTDGFEGLRERVRRPPPPSGP